MMTMGKLVVVSGIDGCGKSTLALSICRYLNNNNIKAVANSAISEASTTIGRQIGNILRDPQTECPLPPNAEHALIIAARCISESNVIGPTLELGGWVVSDRYGLCSSIYQLGPDYKRITPALCSRRLSLFGLDRRPDLEFILDIDPAATHKPPDEANDRLEKRSMEEWNEMRAAYRLASRTQPNARLIDASRPKEEVWEAAKFWIDRLIKEGRV